MDKPKVYRDSEGDLVEAELAEAVGLAPSDEETEARWADEFARRAQEG